MKNVITLILMITLFSTGFSQDYCGSTGEPDLFYFNIPEGGGGGNTAIKVYFNILRETDGSGGYDPQRIPILISILDNAFNPGGIFFEYQCDDIYLDESDDLKDASVNLKWCDWSTSIPKHGDGIDIFIATGYEAPFAGRAGSLPGSFMALYGGTGTIPEQNARIEGTTIVHEMGHLFGLLHMYHGYTQNPLIYTCDFSPPFPISNCGRLFSCGFSEADTDCSTGQLIVDVGECAEDATNGSVAGDYIADTPPSHPVVEGANLNNCAFVLGQVHRKDGNPHEPIIKDPSGADYVPLVTNFMCTNHEKACRDHFTSGQFAVMNKHISMHPILVPLQSSSNATCECDYLGIINTGSTQLLSDIIIEQQLGQTSISNQDLVVQSDLIIDVNYTFNNINIKLSANSKIQILNGITFNMIGGSIMGCLGKRWDRVLLDEGANISFNTVSLSNGRYGVKTPINPSSSFVSVINITGCTFNNFTSIAIDIQSNSISSILGNTIKKANFGIKIKGDFVINNLNRNTIDDAYCGISLSDQSQYLDVNLNVLKDCAIGLSMKNSSGIIEGNTTSNNIYAFLLSGQTQSKIISNTLGSSQIGFRIRDCRGLNIFNNTVGVFQDEPEVAMDLLNVTSSTINQNPQILAKRIGVLANLCNVDILDNQDITVLGVHQKNSGGIILTSCSGGQVLDNLIYGINVAFGIESNNNTNLEIGNNFVTMSPSSAEPMAAAIRSMGGTQEFIKENILYAHNNGDGILLQNSSGNTITCNSADYTQIALNVLDNSSSQHLEANQLEGSQFDLSISSVIGDQVHLGNDFIGDKVIANLTPLEIPDAEFYVNTDGNHFPSNRTPTNNWFKTEDLLDKSCGGIIGPRFTFYDNENALCAYYNQIKQLAKTNKKKYLINLGHILKYSKTKKGFVLPNCIKMDSTFNTVCGLDQLLNVIVKVSMTNDTLRTNVQTSDDFSYTSNQEREQMKDVLKNEYTYDVRWITKDSLKLDSLRSELIAVYCPDTLVNVMKDVWIAYIDLIQSDSIVQNEPSNARLVEIAQLCSSEYGEAVHLARSILLSKGDYTYYDVNDQCDGQAQIRSQENTLIESNMNVSPNPSNSMTYITWNTAQSGTLVIYNAAGAIVQQHKLVNTTKHQITLDESGVYIANFKNAIGQTENKRFIIIK